VSKASKKPIKPTRNTRQKNNKSSFSNGANYPIFKTLHENSTQHAKQNFLAASPTALLAAVAAPIPHPLLVQKRLLKTTLISGSTWTNKELYTSGTTATMPTHLATAP